MGSGVIVRSTNGGASWTSQSGADQKDRYGVGYIDATTGIAVGGGGTILRTTDGGAT
ncbi:MAG TPA: hypothetical protein VK470_20335 [Bacteroidota bacterium]|nr:hypothetical protein [Bacteroidota bacterium]